MFSDGLFSQKHWEQEVDFEWAGSRQLRQGVRISDVRRYRLTRTFTLNIPLVQLLPRTLQLSTLVFELQRVRIQL
jgi:hypothetical protein